MFTLNLCFSFTLNFCQRLGLDGISVYAGVYSFARPDRIAVMIDLLERSGYPIKPIRVFDILLILWRGNPTSPHVILGSPLTALGDVELFPVYSVFMISS